MAFIIAFRVDASQQMGTGHVMRCLALANALFKWGAQCHFISREHDGHLIDLITSSGFVVHRLSAQSKEDTTEPPVAGSQPAHRHWLGCSWQEDAQLSKKILEQIMPDWLVIDHYALDHRWQHTVRLGTMKLMVIDDLADRRHDCDLLLDQTYQRQAEAYLRKVDEHCQLLLGTRYALLRPEFAVAREGSLARRQSPVLRQLLITMGGVDKDNATGRILSSLAEAKLPNGCEIVIVLGKMAPWLEEVKKQAYSLPWPVKVRSGVSDMARLMADSDLAIGAAGSTSWERAALGLPSILVITADNQEQVAKELSMAGAALVADSRQEQIDLNLNEAIEQLMADYANKVAINAAVCDGLGVTRVANALFSRGLCNEQGTWLRDAVMADCEQVYSWQKEPEVRQFARNPEVPSWESHRAWFSQKLAAGDCVFKIVQAAETPVGVVRLDPKADNSRYEVSIYLSTEYSGRGLASQALALIRDQYPHLDIEATVLPENTASHALFTKAGYRPVDQTTYINKARTTGTEQCLK